MKVRYVKDLKDGRWQVLIELAKGEPFPVEPLDAGHMYQLGYPHDEVVAGHVLADTKRVCWDSLGQKWVGA